MRSPALMTSLLVPLSKASKRAGGEAGVSQTIDHRICSSSIVERTDLGIQTRHCQSRTSGRGLVNHCCLCRRRPFPPTGPLQLLHHQSQGLFLGWCWGEEHGAGPKDGGSGSSCCCRGGGSPRGAGEMASRQISPYPFIWQFYSESTGARSEIENYEKLTLNFFFKSSGSLGKMPKPFSRRHVSFEKPPYEPTRQTRPARGRHSCSSPSSHDVSTAAAPSSHASR